MIRKLNVLGLAIAAILAISAVGASAASAAEFHSEAENTTVSGAQTTTHKFTMDPGTVTCKVVTFSGEQTSKTASLIRLVPTYSECTLATIFGNIAAQTHWMGCYVVWTPDLNLSEIKCDDTWFSADHGPVTITGPGCSISIPEQAFGSTTFTNQGSGSSRDLVADTNGSGIKYSYSGFTCGSGSNTTNGTYTGTTTLTGSAGIWWQ